MGFIIAKCSPPSPSASIGSSKAEFLDRISTAGLQVGTGTTSIATISDHQSEGHPQNPTPPISPPQSPKAEPQPPGGGDLDNSPPGMENNTHPGLPLPQLNIVEGNIATTLPPFSHLRRVASAGRDFRRIFQTPRLTVGAKDGERIPRRHALDENCLIRLRLATQSVAFVKGSRYCYEYLAVPDDDGMMKRKRDTHDDPPATPRPRHAELLMTPRTRVAVPPMESLSGGFM